MYKKQCVVCGREFNSVNSAYKICSDECRKIRNAEYCKKYSVIRGKTYQSKYRQKHAKIVLCKICGEPVAGVKGAVNIGRPRYHEECVIKDAIQAILDGEKGHESIRIRRAWNTFGYGVKELKVIMEEKDNDR